MKISVFTDGASRGNPGHAGIGVLVLDDSGKTVFKKSKYLGIRTNNEAEYSALLEAAKYVSSRREDFRTIHFYLDSELVVRQVKGEYRVKNEKLLPLYEKVIKYLDTLIKYSIQHVAREKNKEADKLANLAIDKHWAGEKNGK